MDKIYKYKDIILYLFFGVCTTLINTLSFWVMAHPIGLDVIPSTIIAWVVAVLFAYVTNRKWVFHSEATNARMILKEMVSFFGCRFATGILDLLCMFVFVDILSWNDVLVKFSANILVIVLNYIASKLIIFKQQKTS